MEMQEEALKIKSPACKTYLQEYYNIKAFYELGKNGVCHMATRIINLLIEAFNTMHKLPRFLVIMPDKDILSELNIFDLFVNATIREYVTWMVKQIAMLVRCKRAELLDKKPGVIYAGYPVIIFVQMI